VRKRVQQVLWFLIENVPTLGTLETLRWLSEQPQNKGEIEVRFMSKEPRFNVLAIDASEGYGVIFVETFGQRWIRGGRPRFELRPERDGYWFGYLRDQFDRVWQDCQPVSLDALLTQVGFAGSRGNEQIRTYERLTRA
jgi:hypothetical protein